MNNFLFYLHSGVRWIVVLITVVALLYFALRAMGRLAGDRADKPLTMAFTIGMDIQVTIGIVLLLERVGLYGGFGNIPGGFYSHLGVMLIAAGVAHMGTRRKTGDARTRARNTLITILIVLVLIVVGVLLLPGGSMRWGFAS